VSKFKTIPFDDLAAPVLADPARRAAVERERRETLAEILAYNLAELRKAKAVTQAELAGLLGVRQPSVSALERTEDPHLSTIRAYVEALGGRLQLTAVFGEERIPLDL